MYFPTVWFLGPQKALLGLEANINSLSVKTSQISRKAFYGSKNTIFEKNRLSAFQRRVERPHTSLRTDSVVISIEPRKQRILTKIESKILFSKFFKIFLKKSKKIEKILIFDFFIFPKIIFFHLDFDQNPLFSRLNGKYHRIRSKCRMRTLDTALKS